VSKHIEELNEASISDTFDGPVSTASSMAVFLFQRSRRMASRGRGRRREGIVLLLAAVLAAKEKAESRNHQ
jgi:hypothetical protein